MSHLLGGEPPEGGFQVVVARAVAYHNPFYRSFACGGQCVDIFGHLAEAFLLGDRPYSEEGQLVVYYMWRRSAIEPVNTSETACLDVHMSVTRQSSADHVGRLVARGEYRLTVSCGEQAQLAVATAQIVGVGTRHYAQVQFARCESKTRGQRTEPECIEYCVLRCEVGVSP